MEIGCEPFDPHRATLRAIEGCIGRIRSDSIELAQWFSSYVSGAKERIAFDLDIIRENLPPGTRILEVGSIPLLLTAALAECRYIVTGIDISPERFASSIELLDLTVLKCDVEREKLPSEENMYDAVVFNELFEHLRINPIFTMREVLRVMKPNGLLFLSSPNLRSLMGIKNFLLRKRAYSCASDLYAQYEKLEKLGHMGHVREYTSAEVTDFLWKTGFIVIKVIYRGSYPSKKAQLALRLFPTLRPFISYIARKPAPV
jgi:SAM-dependent methyltransferase